VNTFGLDIGNVKEDKLVGSHGSFQQGCRNLKTAEPHKNTFKFCNFPQFTPFLLGTSKIAKEGGRLLYVVLNSHWLLSSESGFERLSH
jgi:hypothetical protein